MSWNYSVLSQQREDVSRYSLEEGLPSRQVLVADADEEGFLWLGTPKGLSRFDGYDFLTFDSSNTEGLMNHHILSMAISDNVVWLGTRSGIYGFDLASYRISIRFKDQGEIRELHSDAIGNVWICNKKVDI